MLICATQNWTHLFSTANLPSLSFHRSSPASASVCSWLHTPWWIHRTGQEPAPQFSQQIGFQVILIPIQTPREFPFSPLEVKSWRLCETPSIPPVYSFRIGRSFITWPIFIGEFGLDPTTVFPLLSPHWDPHWHTMDIIMFSINSVYQYE